MVATEQGITRLQFERHLHEMRKVDLSLADDAEGVREINALVVAYNFPREDPAKGPLRVVIRVCGNPPCSDRGGLGFGLEGAACPCPDWLSFAHTPLQDTWRAFVKTHDAPDTLPAVSSEGRLIGIAPAPILQLV